jgi:hypothetical protein
MELLEQDIGARPVVQPDFPVRVEPVVHPADELAARRSMRGQIAKLERQLADAFVTAYPLGGLEHAGTTSYRDARMLSLGELERVRDELAERLGGARVTIAERAEIQDAHRLNLERISCRDLGEPGCGVWHVRPRLGLIGMLMGWWQVKLSSGCPLPWAAAKAAAG